MNEDYLWDRSGEPDPEIAHLEQVLGQLRWSKPQVQNFAARKLRRRWPLSIMVAAALLLATMAAAFFWREKHVLGSPTAWQLSLAGGKSTTVRGGQLIETGSLHGTVRSEFVGEVNLEPNSRVRLIAAEEGRQQFALEHGAIHAFIWAPPATFVVDTPAAKTVDLGCRYTLNVAHDGSGFLTVEMGWVAFEWHGIESFIPAGAVCSTHSKRGPGTPYFEDAPKALANAVAEFDLDGNDAALSSALIAARPRDAFTLWHLMERTRDAKRAKVFERYRALVQLPPPVTRDAIVRGDQGATDAAWDALDLGDMSWWRGWKRKW